MKKKQCKHLWVPVPLNQWEMFIAVFVGHKAVEGHDYTPYKLSNLTKVICQHCLEKKIV